jgi:hypothetical protein
VNAAEDGIGLFVSAPPFPPSFDITQIVSIEFEVGSCCRLAKQKMGEEFKPDCLCPSDVPAFGFPTWDK